MAQPTRDDIAEYSKYLIAQGQKPEDVQAYADYLSGYHKVESPKMSGLGAAVTKGEEGTLLGLRPIVAGIGAAAGDVYGQTVAGKTLGSFAPRGAMMQEFDNPKPATVDLKQAGDAFLKGRADANAEQNLAQEQHPYISTAANIGGSLLTLPFLPAKGAAGAMGLGAGLGAAQAAGNANSLGEAALEVGGAAALGGASYGAGKAISATGSKMANSEVGRAVASKAREIGSKVKDFGAKVFSKTAAAITGVPDKEIETYATQYDKVKELIDKSGGNIPHAAEIQKENLLYALKSTKDHLNAQIGEALGNANSEKTVSVSPIIEKLEEYKQRLNISLHPEHIADVDKLVGRINSSAPEGKVNIQELQQIKQFLNEQATGSFDGSPMGFQVGKEAANAAKGGYLQAKQIMDAAGPAEIKNANRQLFQLHRIEDRINKNLLMPGKSDSALMAVGSGVQNRDALAMQRLDKITGKDFMGGANVLAAANRFNNPSFSPAYGTGKALIPVVAGTSIGYATGGPKGAAIGATIGGALASPAALKMAIDTGRISQRALGAVADSFGLQSHNLNALFEVLQAPQAQEILIRALSDHNQAAAEQKLPADATQRRLEQLKHAR